jgi:hypothetical protein
MGGTTVRNDQRETIKLARAQFPANHERQSSNVELANQIRAERQAVTEAELWAHVDALGDAVAVELACTESRICSPQLGVF